MNDEYWMAEALVEARKCLREDEASHSLRSLADVPIGAVCVYKGEIIGRGHNQRELYFDPTAHAEVLAIKAAAEFLQNRVLNEVTLYVTLEPCPMCAGALWLARIGRIVFGAWDSKAGACGSVFDIARDPRLNHRPEVKGGVLEADCADLLKTFFQLRREA